MAYAQDTNVSVERSKAEIEKTLTRYGASQFVSGWDERRGVAMLQFEMVNRRIRFMVKVPEKEQFRSYERKGPYGTTHIRSRSDADVKKMVEQEMKRRWRSLNLVVKAKLEAVASGISEFEEEFLAHIVTESGRTIGEMILPKLDQVSSTGRLPPLLPGHAGD